MTRITNFEQFQEVVRQNVVELKNGMRVVSAVRRTLNFDDGSVVPPGNPALVDLFSAVPREKPVSGNAGLPDGVMGVVTRMKPSKTWNELSTEDRHRFLNWLWCSRIFIIGSFLTMQAHDCGCIVSLIMVDAQAKPKVARSDKFNFKGE